MTIDPITIVFAVVAIFVAWRLWAVLGSRTGAERPPAPRPARFGGDVVDVTPNRPAASERWRGIAAPDSALARGLDAVAAGDPTFDAAHFLAGARAAYEMILNAFAAGDEEALSRLLAPEPLANFSRAIGARKAAGQRMSVTLVSIDGAEIVEAGAPNGAAQVTVKFAAKLNSVTTDSAGQVVEGSATQVANHVDVWTFARPVASPDPNWRLAATEATH